MLSQIPIAYQRLLAFGLPVLCLLVVCLILVPRYRALRADEEEITRTQAVVRDKKARIEAEAGQPLPPPIAYVPDTREEPVVFLRQLSQLAAACGVRFTSVTAVAAEVLAADAAATSGAGGGGNAGTGTATPSTLPTGVNPRALQITVTGPYGAHVRFFDYLENYQRLISLTNVTMDASQHPKLTSQFRLTRFVGPPVTAAAPAAGATGAAR